MTGIETVALIALAAGTAVAAYGQIQEGKARKDASDYNAAVAERNAKVSRQQAAADAAAIDREGRRKIGAVRAAYGAAGVSAEGSPLDVLASSASELERDRQNALYAGELRALGFQDSAALDRFSGRNAQRAGYMGAASSILMTAGDVGLRRAGRQGTGLDTSDPASSVPQSGIAYGY